MDRPPLASGRACAGTPVEAAHVPSDGGTAVAVSDAGGEPVGAAEEANMSAADGSGAMSEATEVGWLCGGSCCACWRSAARCMWGGRGNLDADSTGGAGNLVWTDGGFDSAAAVIGAVAVGDAAGGGIDAKRRSAESVEDPRTLPNSCPPGEVADDDPETFENDSPAVPPRDGDGSASGAPGGCDVGGYDAVGCANACCGGWYMGDGCGCC